MTEDQPAARGGTARWKPTLEEEVAWLRSQREAEGIGRESLEVAANLDWEAARAALSTDDPPRPAPTTPKGWIERLRELGLRGLARAALAAEAVLEPRNIEQLREQLSRPDGVLEQREQARAQLRRALIGYLTDPTDETLGLAGEEAFRARARGWGFVDPSGESEAPLDRIETWARFVLLTSLDPDVGILDDALAAIRTEVVPWALGYRDPLKGRGRSPEA